MAARQRRSALALVAAALALLVGTPCRCLATALPATSAVTPHSCCAGGAARASQPAAKAPSERPRSCDHCSVALPRTSAVVSSTAPEALQVAAVAAPLSHTPLVAVSRFDHPPPPTRLVTQRFLVFRSLLL